MTPLDLDQVIRAVRDLPSLPVIVMDLLETMDHDDASSTVLAQQISQDQAIAAKILRVANSSFYGMSHHVTTIGQAVSILGFSTVRALVTAASISGAFIIDPRSSFDFPRFWKHAVATALCAKYLAPLHRVAPDRAFITGLLHDIGQLVLTTRFPEAYAVVMQTCRSDDCSVVEAEHLVLQIDHSTVGAALAQHWRFPPSIQQAVLLHHADSLHDDDPLIALAQVANAIAHALDLADDPMETVPEMATAAWQAVALDQATLARILPLIEAEFFAISPILVG